MLIVVEVALGVFTLFLGGMGYRYVWLDTAEAPAHSDRILSAQLTIPRTVLAEDAGEAYTPEFRQQLRTTHQELARRLALEPGVRGVAMANVLPGQDHFGYRRLEVEGSEGVSDYLAAHQVSVSVGFFGVLGQPILRGRDLAPGDLPGGGEGDGSAVIVNNAFVDHVLGGRNPIGQRVRFVASRDEDPHPWYEIVGLVGTLDMGAGGDLLDPPIGIYLPTGPGELNPLQIVIDVGTDPASFASRLREIASEVDPSAMVEQTLPLDQIVSANRLFIGWAIILMVATAGVAVVLSIAGVYALMSFTVAQRTREIGIRTALGAPRESIVSVIVRRAFGQLALGVLLGVAGGVALATTISVQDRPAGWLSTLALVAGMTVSVGLLACIVPTLRGLRIPPTEALRADG